MDGEQAPMEIAPGVLLHAAYEGRDRHNYFCRVVAVGRDTATVQPQRIRSQADKSVEYPDYGWDWPEGDADEPAVELTRASDADGPYLLDAARRLHYRLWDGKRQGYRYA